MAESSSAFYFKYAEASQRFDYYVTGLAAALAAYVGKSLQPVRLEALPQSLDHIAVVFLIASVVCGFKQLESGVLLLKLQAASQHSAEQANTASQIAFDPRGGLAVMAGRLVGAPELAAHAEAHRDLATSADQSIAKAGKASYRFYQLRNASLFLGAIVLVLSRVLPAYL